LRPLSIELEGFFAYRKRALVDLSGVDYFSLEGPTGSGKSSLIDAMIFALYGRIPRLGGNTVGPAITAGADRARVSFTFLANDFEYTATRQLERTQAGGARATEVRLESGDIVIASGSADVGSEVTRLLNLSYEDFTRTVVLPQGEFARFLTATPKDRQELLRGLLGLDVYRTMGSLARTREQVARSEWLSASHRLDDLVVPSDEEQRAAEDRLTAIVELSGRVDQDEEELKHLGDRVGALEQSLDQTTNSLGRLRGLTPPPHLEELSALLVRASDQADKHVANIASIEKQQKAAVEELSSLPDEGSLSRFVDLYARLDGIEKEIAGVDIAGARGSLESAEAAVANGRETLALAQSVQEEARTSHAAHVLARRLKAGDPCPVCQQSVAVIPQLTATIDLDAIDAAAQEAAARLDKARESVSALTRDLANQEAAQKQMSIKREELMADLARAPGREDIPDLMARVEAASAAVANLEEQKRSITRLIAETEEERSRLAEQQRSLGRLLMAEREKLVDLKPPIAESEDILIQWKELLSWKEELLVGVARAEVGLREQIEAATSQFTASVDRLNARLEAVGIAAGKSPSVAVARAEEQAKQAVVGQAQIIKQAALLRDEASAASEKASVAESLARHLRSDGFERWMMVGAIAELVSGANSILDELSRSSYSLHSDDDGSFDIVDHRNADEIRPVSTLSGGETFLVSLALALSLAETLASGSGSRLDAIILDEGFGTLDDESLDVVASVLESLTMSGLMVGIITHVKALASRAPARFVVHKGPDGSRVEAVE
jgi:exonuclease SbcC